MSRFTLSSGGAFATAACFAVVLSAVSPPAIAAEQVAPTTQVQPKQAQPKQTETTQATTVREQRNAERAEARIKRMHDRLDITPAQEDAWGKVAKVMRENSATYRATIGEKYRQTEHMSAVDDLKSFQLIADEHSAGLKKLIPAFETLYGALTPDQQKRADRVFSRRERHAAK